MTGQITQKCWLRELREKASLSQEVLAVELGVALSTYRRWDKGEAEPSLTRSQWLKLSAKLNVPVDELIAGTSASKDSDAA